MSRADWKGLGRRRFEPLCAGCGQVEGAGTGEPQPRDRNSIPRKTEPAPYEERFHDEIQFESRTHARSTTQCKATAPPTRHIINLIVQQSEALIKIKKLMYLV
ncbi:unnamed protein product [Parnassius mnemosyne]|uniref:Uncharacterized protein n=1 Tax=Parnassius mnemosyne TaxID=213953 RepID=A0AAV1KCS4_9NEOP